MKDSIKIEQNSLLYLISRPLFLGLGITKIIDNVKGDVWISIIIGTFLGLIINYILTKTSNKYNKYFYYLYNFSLLLLSSTILTKLISSLYLNKTGDIYIIFPFLLLLLYTVKKGKTNLYKVAGILIIINILLFIIPVVALIPTMKIDSFLPIYTTSIKKILISALDFALISTVPYTLIQNYKEKYNPKIYLLSCLSMSIIFIIIIGSLGPNLASIYRFPEYVIFKKISLLSFLEHIENLLFIIWIFDVFILCSKASLNIYKVSSKVFYISLFLILIETKIVLSNNTYLSFISEYYTYILITVFLLYLLSKIKINNS